MATTTICGPFSVKVDVTAEDIAKGVRVLTTECPIALALRRALRISTGSSDIRVSVGAYQVHVLAYGLELHAELPSRAHDFLRWFDRGLPVDPIQFNLTFE